MRLSGPLQQRGLDAFRRKFPLFHGRRRARIWIIVANEGIAKVFRKDDGHLEFVGLAKPEALNTEIEFSKGRMASAADSTIQHKFEPHMEQSRQEVLSFMRDLARWMEETERSNVFDRLIIIAAPKTLGDLRSVVSKAVQSRISAEIDKDLTKLNEDDLRKALNDILWF